MKNDTAVLLITTPILLAALLDAATRVTAEITLQDIHDIVAFVSDPSRLIAHPMSVAANSDNTIGTGLKMNVGSESAALLSLSIHQDYFVDFG